MNYPAVGWHEGTRGKYEGDGDSETYALDGEGPNGGLSVRGNWDAEESSVAGEVAVEELAGYDCGCHGAETKGYLEEGLNLKIDCAVCQLYLQ